MGRLRSTGIAAAAAALGLAAGLLWRGASSPPAAVAAVASAPPSTFSLVAFGDTGHPVGLFPSLSGQYRVARALAVLDRADPIDGVVLLGDNFYPDGLEDGEFKERVRENLVTPYCRFLRFTDRGRGSLEEACPVDPADRHPVPIYAVLGNHDHNERESPLLQRKRIPEYVANWHMPEDPVAVHSLPGGVDLILMDSMHVARGNEPTELALALRASEGPLRIIAAHHPMADTGRGYEPDYAEQIRIAVERAVEREGKPVHLFLAGHAHNLQVLEMGFPDPPLHVVAGSGSEVREPRESAGRRHLALGALGFARVDRVDVDGRPGLRATVYVLEGVSTFSPGTLRAVWRGTVDVDLRLTPEPIGPPAA